MAPTPLTGTRKLHHASGLCLDGIRAGRIDEALAAHTSARYTQHSTGVGHGREGCKALFGPFLERNPVRHIEVARAIADGPYVFLHVFQSLNNGESQWGTADLVATDSDERVIEHWDVIQAFETETASGRSMVDGPTEIEDLDKTEANKERVAVLS